MICKCNYCGKEIYRRPCEIRKNKTGKFYCNKECRDKDWVGSGNPNYGNKWSDDARKKASEYWTGRVPWNKGLTAETSESVRKNVKHLYGNTFGRANKGKIGGERTTVSKMVSERNRVNNPMKDPITRKKVSKALIGKFCGDKNPNWKGGISFGKYCPKFNETVKRDVRNKFNHKCFICGIDEDINGRKLDVHHVDYDKYQGCDGKKWVLVPLCRSCHSKTSSGNREYWNSYLVDKISLIGDEYGSVNGV